MLIQNEKTLESFQEFHDLFIQALDKKEIGVCRWTESGTDMDTALPELLDLVDEKEEWRAVIVLTEQQSTKIQFATSPQNPFDFVDNKIKKNVVEESDIPLIRLTHILDGVPAPEVEFECKQITEKNKAPRMIYKPIKQREKEVAYEALADKYAYAGKKPSEILIVSLRKKMKNRNKDLVSIWQANKEINSSEFWLRNNYPSICRFLVYDFENQGHTQEYSDMFNFWLSVMLITTNRINANTLQAYRLYKIKSTFSKKLMEAYFQRLVYRLSGAQRYIKDTLQNEEKIRLQKRKQLPEYSLNVSVNLDLVKKSDLMIDTDSFALAADDGGNDAYKWESLKAKAEGNLKKLYKVEERSLNEAAEKARELCVYPEEGVYSLEEYQQDDMKEDLNVLYGTIIDMQKSLPKQRKSTNKDKTNTVGMIKNCILHRVKRATAMNIFFIIITLLSIAAIPGIVYGCLENPSSVLNLIFVSVILGGLLTITEILILYIQKKRLGVSIQNYNDITNGLVGEIYHDADIYSRYISNIVSHLRGTTFLDALSRNKLKKGDGSAIQREYLKEFDLLLKKLKKWCTANYLDIQFTSDYYEEVTIDHNMTPQHMKLNIMQCANKYPVSLNDTGDIVESPFEFVARLAIVREELYDDAQYS